MSVITTMIDRLDWTAIAAQLNSEGYAIVPDLLSSDQSRALARYPDSLTLQRQVLNSVDQGRGELFYFDDRLTAALETLRSRLYHHLAAIANHWNEILGITYRYPAALDAFCRHNRDIGQNRALSHLSRLCEDDYLPLQQRNEGECVFPLQLVAVLTEPGQDFQGGEFVMTEQRPRMQSRPMVLPLQVGNTAIISTAQRPFKGSKGFYRVNTKHAISRVRAGERIGLELSFHGAP